MHALAPYNTRGSRDTRNSRDGIYQQTVADGTGRVPSGRSGDLLLVQFTPAEKAEDGYAGAFEIGVALG